MSGGRPWYREPESFIAIAALVVSISAVAVGVYEAALQRAHDRAEVWPHVEVGTFTTPTDATLYVENTGVGPAVISSIVFTLDGKPRTNWNDLVTAWLDKAAPSHFGRSTVAAHSLRAGDKVVVLDLPMNAIPDGFWDYIHRVGVTICYRSVFDEYWLMSQPELGGTEVTWTSVSRCPEQSRTSAF